MLDAVWLAACLTLKC